MKKNIEKSHVPRTWLTLLLRSVLLVSLLAGFNLIAQEQAAEGEEAAAEEVPQQEPEYDEIQVESITVTAQKRASSLQDTPIALSVVTGETLENNVVQDLRDVALFTPGLVVSGTAAFEYPIAIRGISSAVSGIGADTPVAVYVDGVYLGRPSSAVFELVDTERIEVLRGPQGTLYGRNATGGAINIITNTPKNDLDILVDTHYGSFSENRIRGSVSGALVPDKLYASIAAVTFQRDGWGTNVPDGREINAVQNENVRASMRYLPNERTTLIWRLDAGASDDALGAKDIGGTVITDPGSPDDFFINEDPYGDRAFWGTSLTLDHKIGNLTFKSISAYRENEYTFFFDSDAGPNQFVRLLQDPEKQNQFSQEFQVLNTEPSRLKWQLGLYYFREDSETNIIVDNFLAGITAGTFPTNQTNSYAGYGEATYNITNRLSVTGGLRYSRESKDFTNSVGNIVPVLSTPEPGNVVAYEKTWDSWTPKLVVDMRWNEHLMTYVSVSEGFKSGGFNFLSADPSFDPEELTAVEMGVKSDTWNKRVRLNAAAFTYDYTNLQVRIPGAPGQIFIQNAAEAEVSGLEVETAVRATRALQLNANLAFLDAEYSSYERVIRGADGEPILDENGNTVIEDLSGNRLNRAPEWKFGVSAEYLFPATNHGAFRLFGSYQYESEAFYTEINEPVSSHDGWHNINARATMTFFNGVSVAAFGRNLTDERYVSNVIPIGAWRAAAMNIGRTAGLEVSYKF